jgi:hypothetical protein
MLKSVLSKFYISYLNRKKLSNFFQRKNTKNALLIYLVEPFFREKITHGNYFEVRGLAYALDSLNYNVDVVNHSYKVDKDFTKYDLIIGFGEAFDRLLNNPLFRSKAILYATSQHSFILNKSAMGAIKRFYQKSKLRDLSLVRYRHFSWQATYDLVDGIIVVDGSGFAKKTYIDNSLVNAASIKSVSPPYIAIYEGQLKQNDSTKMQFIWFAGDGPVHKGLDLLLEYFYKNKELTLHVVGNISKYKNFFEYYFKHLKYEENIMYYGFLDVKSPELLKIALNCDFVILPSCSEGMPNGLTTVVGNFGCIPVLTEESSFFVPHLVKIKKLNDLGLDAAINSCKSLKIDLGMKIANRNFVVQKYTNESYIKMLIKSIKRITSV